MHAVGRGRNGEDGVTSFAALQDTLSKSRSGDLVYFVFDLLLLDRLDLRPLPLIRTWLARRPRESTTP